MDSLLQDLRYSVRMFAKSRLHAGDQPQRIKTMGIALKRGRDFDAGDNESAPRVAIINDAMTRRYWADQNPIGKRISIGEAQRSSIEIIGVVKTGTYRAPGEESTPQIYLPLAQRRADQLTIIARTAGNPLVQGSGCS